MVLGSYETASPYRARAKINDISMYCKMQAGKYIPASFGRQWILCVLVDPVLQPTRERRLESIARTASTRYSPE